MPILMIDKEQRVTPPSPNTRPFFSDYWHDAANWVTLATGEYYPDILEDACELYKPVLVLFGQILKRSETSCRLFMELSNIPDRWMKVQLARVFRKYASPDAPVEMLKKKKMAKEVCEQFGSRFRPISEVQGAFCSRPIPIKHKNDFSQRWPRLVARLNVGRLLKYRNAVGEQNYGDDPPHGSI
jgi:hypothetical protein